LPESNVSWNATLNYKPETDMLLYGRVAKGYKSGHVPTEGTNVASQYDPVKQESLLAYEAGSKLTLFKKTLQVDWAAFYYDYKNKQISAYVNDPIFGPLQGSQNVPKSKVQGSELAVNWLAARGVNLSAAVTYLDTKVLKFTSFDPESLLVRDYAGAKLAFSPTWTGTTGFQYDSDIPWGLHAFGGVDASFRSGTSGILAPISPDFKIPGYATVDIQVGVESDKKWTVKLWGRNVFNRFYLTNAFKILDTDVRATGMPATFGVTVGYKL
jgi:outer membrane receptor protein involved in Fe transport